MSIPATRRLARNRGRVHRWEDSESPLLRSRFLPRAARTRAATFGCEQTAVDQFHCHVISDKSAEKLDEADEHRLECLGCGGISVRHDGRSDAVDVGLRPGAELNLFERWVLSLRLRECASEKRVTAVWPNPPRKFTIEMLACGSGGARGSIGSWGVGATTYQAARNFSCWRVARQTFLTGVGLVHKWSQRGIGILSGTSRKLQRECTPYNHLHHGAVDTPIESGADDSQVLPPHCDAQQGRVLPCTAPSPLSCSRVIFKTRTSNSALDRFSQTLFNRRMRSLRTQSSLLS